MTCALKITAERIADCGVRRPMMFSALRTGNAPANIAGIIAKYFATSFAIENVVKAPRVINSYQFQQSRSALLGWNQDQPCFRPLWQPEYRCSSPHQHLPEQARVHR